MTHRRDQASSLVEQQRFDAALPIWLSIAKEEPYDWWPFYMAGQCCRFLGHFTQAVWLLAKADTLNPNDAQVLFALGIANQLDENHLEAIRKLEQAISLEPTLISAYNSLGLTYKKLGNPIEALTWYNRAADALLSMTRAETTRNPELCYRDEIVNGKLTRTVLPYLFTRVQSLLRADPTYSVIKNNIGVCLMELGEHDAARAAFEESIEFIPDGYDYPDPHKNLHSISR
jgi:tetratricopeptide (TPR) repeat protein